MKYEYDKFCHGMEYNLDRYLARKEVEVQPIIHQGVVKRQIKKTKQVEEPEIAQ